MGTEISVLMYHEVGRRRKYGLRPEDFESQMRRIAGLKIPVVVPEEVERGVMTGGRAVMITFDDGHASDCAEALPVLTKYGFRGVSFVTTGFVGREGYLSWGQVRRLREAGFSVQSHTHSHPLLNVRDDRSVREELRRSKRLLEDRLGSEVSCLALPGGGYAPRVVRIAREEGYRFVYSSIPGINRVFPGIPEIWYRMRVSHRTPRGSFDRILALDRKTYALARLAYRVRSACKRVVGHERYQLLWRRYYR